IAGIFGANVDGSQVFVNSSGQLGMTTSSARFKQDIQTMGGASTALLALRPVTFRYKPEIDPYGKSQFGLVAEEVEKVNPSLVVRDKEGKPCTVRYDAVNAMLLNEFLKEHKRVQEQQCTIEKQQSAVAQLKSTVAAQQESFAQQEAQIQALTSGLQRVSAQLEMSKSTAKVV